MFDILAKYSCTSILRTYLLFDTLGLDILLFVIIYQMSVWSVVGWKNISLKQLNTKVILEEMF